MITEEKKFVALLDDNENVVFWTNHFIDSASINLECWLEIALRHGIKMLDDNLAERTISGISVKNSLKSRL